MIILLLQKNKYKKNNIHKFNIEKLISLLIVFNNLIIFYFKLNKVNCIINFFCKSY